MCIRDSTLTITSALASNNQAVFDAEGEAIVCVWITDKWYIVSNFGTTLS